MKIPMFHPSIIDPIDVDDIEENSFTCEEISCLGIPNDPLDSLEWLVNNEEIATGVTNFFCNTPMDDKTRGLLSDKSHENQKICSTPDNTPTTPGMSCVTSSGNQNINGTRDLSKDLPKTKCKRGQKIQKHWLNVRWSKKKKRNSSSQKRRIWFLETPVWLLNNPLKEEDKNSTRGEENEVQPAAYMRNETENFRSQTCSYCGTKETPQWRRGPKGPGSLCNACGIRYRTGNIKPKRQQSKRCEITAE